MFSVRQLAHCMLAPFGGDGVWPGPIAVRQDLFGHPNAGSADALLELMRRITRKVVDLNLILVGDTGADEDHLDAALTMMQVLYLPVGMRVRRAGLFAIGDADGEKFEYIDSHDEAGSLTEEFTVAGDGIDVFLVSVYAGATVGRSPVNGTCDKSRTTGMTGCVVAVEGDSNLTGFTLAHEVGHYLGLNLIHSLDPDNLMFSKVPNGGELTQSQGERMKDHCFVRTGC